MATIRKNRNKWQAMVRRVGFPQRSKCFETKREATKWAQQEEAMIDLGMTSAAKAMTIVRMSDLLKRYLKEVTPQKRGFKEESIRLRKFLGEPWAKLKLSALSPSVFSSYRDRRLKQVQPSTVRRELGLLRAVLEYGMREWGIDLKLNPVSSIAIPKEGKSRDRRPTPEELELLIRLSESLSAPFLNFGIVLAIETGMRRGELLSVLWSDLNLSESLLTIRETKNGHNRTIPLSTKAREAFFELKSCSHNCDDKVFPISANAFRLSWQRLRGKACSVMPEIKTLRFHDLRHEAVSRFFELGLSVPEVALISGHRDVRMLFKYTHLKPEMVLSKLS